MLFQVLSAKLGIVIGRNLAELCREQLSRPVVLAMWIVSEIAAMATDLAEFLGGAIGLSLLFRIPLLAGMIITAIVVYGILLFQRNGFRPIELIIGSLVATISLYYLIEIFIAPVDWGLRLGTRSCRNLPVPRRWCSPSALSAPSSCRARSICILG